MHYVERHRCCPNGYSPDRVIWKSSDSRAPIRPDCQAGTAVLIGRPPAGRERDRADPQFNDGHPIPWTLDFTNTVETVEVITSESGRANTQEPRDHPTNPRVLLHTNRTGAEQINALIASTMLWNKPKIITGIAAPRVLFISQTGDVGSERLPAALQRAGCVCACLGERTFLSLLSGSIAQSFVLPSQRGVWLGTLLGKRCIERAVAAFAPEVLIPLDDVASWLLRGLHATGISPRLRELIERSCGDPDFYRPACRRADLMSAAAATGVPHPGYIVPATLTEALRFGREWGFPVVAKREQSSGGNGVRIVRDESGLRALFDRSNIVARLRREARAAIWARAGIPRISRSDLLLQSFVEGSPAMCTVVADRGVVVESLAFVAETVHPENVGSASVLRFVEHAGMEETAARMVQLLRCSGFVSFDFMLRSADRKAMLIEMNPRPIGSVHLGRRFGRDLCQAFMLQCSNLASSYSRGAAEDDRTVALFPKELARDPRTFSNGVPDSMVHDIPWEHTNIVAGYRRFLQRLHPTCDFAPIFDNNASARNDPQGP